MVCSNHYLLTFLIVFARTVSAYILKLVSRTPISCFEIESLMANVILVVFCVVKNEDWKMFIIIIFGLKRPIDVTINCTIYSWIDGINDNRYVSDAVVRLVQCN